MADSEVLLAARAVRLARSGEARRIRLAAGVSTEVVAGECDVTTDAVVKWEKGLRMPSGRRAVRYGRVLTELEQVSAGC